jgi:hypothetical protein
VENEGNNLGIAGLLLVDSLWSDAPPLVTDLGGCGRPTPDRAAEVRSRGVVVVPSARCSSEGAN